MNPAVPSNPGQLLDVRSSLRRSMASWGRCCATDLKSRDHDLQACVPEAWPVSETESLAESWT